MNSIKQIYMSPKQLWVIIAIPALIIITVMVYFAITVGNDKKVTGNSTVTPTKTSQTDKPVVSTEETNSKLKTYQDTQYGFEFKYPEDIYQLDNPNDLEPSENGSEPVVSLTNVKQKAESIACSCGEVEVFGVSVLPNSLRLSLAAFAKKNYSDEYSDYKEKTVAGYKAIGLGEIGFHYLISKGDYVFDVYPTDDIMPTFKFTK